MLKRVLVTAVLTLAFYVFIYVLLAVSFALQVVLTK